MLYCFVYFDSLAEDLKNFSVNITEWLLDALEDLPAQLGIRKMHGKEKVTLIHNSLFVLTTCG